MPTEEKMPVYLEFPTDHGQILWILAAWPDYNDPERKTIVQCVFRTPGPGIHPPDQPYKAFKVNQVSTDVIMKIRFATS